MAIIPRVNARRPKIPREDACTLWKNNFTGGWAPTYLYEPNCIDNTFVMLLLQWFGMKYMHAPTHSSIGKMIL